MPNWVNGILLEEATHWLAGFVENELMPAAQARVSLAWRGVRYGGPGILLSPGTTPVGGVMAMGDEIVKGIEIQGELRKTGATFLDIELETSLTFAEEALTAGNDLAKRNRDRVNARKGYNTLLRFRLRFPIPPSEERKFDEKLRQLKSDLERLGEKGL